MEKVFGRIIVISGLDGVGKTTQMDLLEASLKEKGEKVYRTKYPRYGTESGKMIERYLNGELGIENPNPLYISSLYLNDMYEDYTKNWKSLYEEGYIILLDRYFESSLMYQGNLNEEDPRKMRRMRSLGMRRPGISNPVFEIENMVLGLGLPGIDNLIFLSAPEEVRINAMKTRGGEIDVLEANLPLQRRIEDFTRTYFRRGRIDSKNLIHCFNEVRVSNGQEFKLREDIHKEIDLITSIRRVRRHVR